MDMPYSYGDLLAKPPVEKRELMKRDGRLFHVILADQFDRVLLDRLCWLGTALRKIAHSRSGLDFLGSLLAHRSAMLFFTQSSTRTFLSFVRAVQYLGMNYAEVRDPATSSIIKGETHIDSVRTFSSYFDLIIMRHHEAQFAERVAYMMNEIGRPIPVMNGGAGADEHPTQACLDIYTLQRSFEKQGGIDGKHVVFVGDIRRGRTVRSLAQLLLRYDGVKMTFIAPPELAPSEDLRRRLSAAGADFTESADLDAVLPDADAVYMTRIQDEHDKAGESSKINYKPFCLTVESMKRLKSTGIVMHPFPRRDEIDTRIDSDPRAMYWRQERNGMWMRAALISYVFNLDEKVEEYFNENCV